MRRRDFFATGSIALTPAWASERLIENRVAIQNVCAWPKLEKLKDGTILAYIFNQPCHGIWEGDLDCWESKDQGRTWRFRSRVAAHEPGTNRMNCASGVARNGDLIVLCSGWTNKGPVGQVRSGERKVLKPWICRSSDGGRSWKVDTRFPDPPQTDLGKDNNFIPFGAIETAADGSLCAAVYLVRGEHRTGYLLRSRDDGVTWEDRVPLNPTGNETWILHLGSGRWLAASREFKERRDVHIELFYSHDDARTWRRGMPLSLPLQITGNLIRLSDGRVLFTCGNRNWGNYGVDARLSDDEGKTWSPPFRLANCPYSDCGYPSSAEISGGSLVTAYYTRISEDFHYEMRVAIWNPRRFGREGTPS